MAERRYDACVICGGLLPGADPRRMYCSDGCKDRARLDRGKAQRRTQRRALTCQQCGVELANRPQARFCSPKCGTDYHNAEMAAARLATKPERACLFCGMQIPPDLKSSRLYCNDECKSRGRRALAYNLSQTELDRLLEQHGVCAICASDTWGKKGPQVDHCHDTGQVRGVLCNNCNNGLGRFKDDPARLRAAADYVEAHASP